MKKNPFSSFCPVALLFLVLPWAAAQGTQGSANGTGTDSGGTAQPRMIPVQPIIAPPPETRLPDLQAMPEMFFVAGLVMQDDGAPPPFGTVIELDCGDTITREATVDVTGHYGFHIGSTDRMGRVMPDASDGLTPDPFDPSASNRNSPTGSFTSISRTPLSVRLLRCELRAQYPGFRSTAVRIDPGRTTGYAEVDSILVYRLDKVQGTSVSLTSLIAPKEAKKAMERGEKALKKDQFAEAEELLKSSVQIYPKNAQAWYLLGQAHHLQHQNQEAMESYRKALDLDGNFVRPYIPLARLELAEESWEDAAELSDRALDLDPVSYPEAYLLNAISYYKLDNLNAAEKSARRGLRLDVTNKCPQLHLVLANILSRNNDDPGSLQEMHQYLKAAPNAADAPQVRSRIQDKEKLVKADNK